MSSKPSAEFLKSAAFLIDSSSYIFRAYYAIRSNLTAADGTPTHATFGFLQMLFSLMDTYKPSDCVLVWDHKEKGFRHEIATDYKANRSLPPADLGLQINNTKSALGYLGFCQMDMAGYEADDIIATLIRKNPEKDFVIVTADKDLLQLVGPHVWCLDTYKNVWSNVEEAKLKFGVEPEKIPLVQALSGDAVDNIHGAPGIGPKSATELIQHYGDLEKLFEAAAARAANPTAKPAKGDPLKGKRVEAIAQNVEQIRTSLKLVSLHGEVPVNTECGQFKIQAPQREPLGKLCQALGFTKLLDRVNTLHWSGDAGLGSSTPTLPADLERAESPLGEWKAVLVKNIDELRSILQENSKAPVMALDTETLCLECRKSENLVGVSFSFEGNKGYYVPVRHTEGENLNPAEVIDALGKFLRDRAPDLLVIFQNAKFDLHVLSAEGLAWPAGLRIEDTMVASFVLDPNENHGMDELSAKYLSYSPQSYESVVEDAENFSFVPPEKAAFYSAEDAVVTLRLWETLAGRLQENSLFEVYEKLDRPLVEVLVQMEKCGVAINLARLEELSKELHEELKAQEAHARQLLIDSGLELEPDFNLASPKQVAHVLYEKLQLPVVKRTKTGPSTDVKALQEISHLHPFPQALVDLRELSKLLSTYIDALPQLVDAKTHRLHTDFSQTIAATGRLSSSNPNLQNIPIRTERGRKIRDAFYADDGHCLIGVDYSQVELRILAHMSQDPELLRAFREEADIHRRTAALVLKRAESEVSDEERRMAKGINFGIVYGQSAFGLSKTLKIPRAQAQAFIDKYFETYPGIKEYMERAVAEAKDTGAVRTLTGRRRFIPEIRSSNHAIRQFGERMAINSPIQGTAADLMKAAMIAVHRDLKGRFPKARLVLQVHDELLIEAPHEEATDLKVWVKETLEDPNLLKDFGISGFSVLMKAEASMGRHWGEL